jgi:hypothetical protein
MTLAHPRTYCLALLAIKRSPRKIGSIPEFGDIFAQYVRTAAQSKASELSGHYGQEKQGDSYVSISDPL